MLYYRFKLLVSTQSKQTFSPAFSPLLPLMIENAYSGSHSDEVKHYIARCRGTIGLRDTLLAAEAASTSCCK